jgi:hypothetical protein
MRKHLDLFLVSVVAFSAYQFYYVWLAWKGFSYLELVAYSLEDRPYVYRLLIPVLSRALEGLTGIHAVYCMIFLFVLSAIGLFYALRYLYTAFLEDHSYASIVSFVGCEITFLLILLGVKVYDIATAMFFALSLGLLARGKYIPYYLLFAIASLNRDTTFLLTLFFIVYFLNRMPRPQYFFGVLYQIFAYIAVKASVMSVYAEVPGELFFFNPIGVIKGYGDQPEWFAILILSFFVVLLGMALYQRNDKPKFLRAAFMTIFPAQLVLHVFLGYPYEIRVFAEMMPVLLLLSAWSIPSVKYGPSLQESHSV